MLEILSQMALVLCGFGFMILGAERMLKGAVDLALKLNLSKAFVGAVLVGFGTSAPELFTSLISASNGEGTLAAGNVIGSNVFNGSLVMGTCLLFPFKLHKSERSGLNWALLLLPSFMLIFFFFDLNISKFEALGLLLPLPVFFYFLSKQTNEELEDSTANTKNSSFYFSLIWVALGGAALYFGSQISIASSLKLATLLGFSKGFAGAILLAAGTGLPELVTTVVAGLKKELSLAFANILGSNALNAFGILGVTALSYPLEVTEHMGRQNVFFLLVLSLMLVPIFIIKSPVFHKVWAALLFCLYFLFMTQN